MYHWLCYKIVSINKEMHSTAIAVTITIKYLLFIYILSTVFSLSIPINNSAFS